MRIKIITDSTSDILPDDAAKSGIEIVPLKVSFGEEEYIDKFTITNDEFYQKLKKSRRLPTTTLVNPEQFVDVFNRHGDEDILGIFISSKLSGTYQSAVIAKELVGRENIYLIDSGTVTIGMILLIYHAVRMKDEGKTAEEIYKEIIALASRISIYAVIDTLEYLVKGGRLSAAQGLLGGALGIKPIIRVKDGVIQNVGKARGVAKAIAHLEEELFRKGLVDSAMPIAFAHFENQSGLDIFMKCFPSNGQRYVSSIGSVVGTHSGPGVSAIAFFEQKASPVN